MSTDESIAQSFEDLPNTAEEIRAALELRDVLDSSPFRAVLQIDNPVNETTGPYNFYNEQRNIGTKLQGLINGSSATLVSKDIKSNFGPGETVDNAVRAVRGFHDMIHGLTQHLGIPKTGLAFRLTYEDPAKFIEPLGIDFLLLCDQGLIDTNGNTSNLEEATKRLMFINLVCLFSKNVSDPAELKQVYATLYNQPSERMKVDEEDVERYYQELAQPASRGGNLKKLTQDLGPQALPTINRAAERMMLGIALSLFTEIENSPHLKELYAKALEAAANEDVAALHQRAIDALNIIYGYRNSPHPVNIESVMEASTLDWEVFPSGELKNHAETIVAEATKQSRPGKPPVIDLERLTILTNIQQMWGLEDSYFARGKFSKKPRVKEGDKEVADEYIILVLQEKDAEGNVIAENAVGESPIAGPNALYVFRQDVSEGLKWGEVMALPKDYARGLGARSIKHTQPKGETSSLIATMSEKAATLLQCTVEEFASLKFTSGQNFYLSRN